MSAPGIIIHKLLADDAVTDIVGTRVYPILAPQGAGLPQIVIHIVDNFDEPTLSGPGKYYRTKVQADCYTSGAPGQPASKVLELGEAVMECLNGIIKDRIVVPGHANWVDIDVLFADLDETSYDLDRNCFRRVIHFNCRWRNGAADSSG